MASVFNVFKQRNGDGGVDWDTTASSNAKIVLLTTAYSIDVDQDTLDDGTTTDWASRESSGTGYTKGFAGAGRKAVASRDVVLDDTNNRARFTGTTSYTWTSINVGTVGFVGLAWEGALAGTATTSDTAALPVCIWAAPEFTGTTAKIVTNGGNLTLNFSTVGLLTSS